MVENISYSYVLEHDTGFAPNPFFGYLTLAACKPCLEKKGSIRKLITKESLKKGPVWVFANGGTNLLLEDFEYRNGNLLKVQPNCTSYNRLVYAFRVDEVLNFEKYYQDSRFKRKKRINSKTQIETFGDNNLHSPKSSKDKRIKQYIEDPKVKFSNQELKKIGDSNLLKIYVDNVLISAEGEFYYFGCFAPKILEEYGDHFRKGSPGHKPIKDEKIRDKIIEKFEEICTTPGIYGFPTFHKKKHKVEANNLGYLREVYHNCFNSKTQKIIADWINKMQNIDDYKNQTLKSII